MLAIFSVGLANTLVLSRVVIIWENRPVRLLRSHSVQTNLITEGYSPDYDHWPGSKFWCSSDYDAPDALGCHP